MPKFLKLDNSGKPFEPRIIKVFTGGKAKALTAMKNCKWKLIENDKPMLSKENPIPVEVSPGGNKTDVKDFPLNKEDQIKWINQQISIAALLTVKSRASKPIKTAIDERIELLTNKK